MKYKDFYDHILLEDQSKNIEEFIDIWKSKNKDLHEYSCTLGNCGVYINKFIKDAKEAGFGQMKKIFGRFISDKPSFDKNDFTAKEIADMIDKKYDPNKKESRISYAKDHNLFGELKKVPHYWIEDVNGNIIDLVAYEQFVKVGLSKDINPSRYKK